MQIKPATPEAYQLFHDGILALARAERQGIRVDVEYCIAKKEELGKRISQYQTELEETKLYRRWKRIYKKPNIHSNHQLAKMLYSIMKIEPTRVTESGQGSTDEEALQQLGVPGLNLILSIRKLAKMRKTYLGAFVREQVDGYMHPSFNLHTVKTYRSSSADPNFQNIPIRDKEAMEITRRAILPRPGHMLLEGDFSALEVNISQCYHKDPNMLRYLLDKNSDMHLDMAKQIFMFEEINRSIAVHNVLRNAAKNGFVFPQFYGDYYGNNAHTLSAWLQLPKGRWKDGMGIELPDGGHISNHLRQQGIPSFDKFVEHMKNVETDFWQRRFRGYHDWRERWTKEYRRKGWMRMHTGFVCTGIMRKNEILNYPIQGSAFHCLLFVFIQLDKMMRKEKWRSRLIGQIHDSIILDVYPDELERVEESLHYIVREVLPAAWKWIIVPLEIEVETYAVDGSWVK